MGAEDATLVERVAALGGKPDAENDPHLYGTVWESLWNLLDEGWCRRCLHQFACTQAAAIRPAIRRLQETAREAESADGEDAAEKISAPPDSNLVSEMSQVSRQMKQVVLGEAHAAVHREV